MSARRKAPLDPAVIRRIIDRHASGMTLAEIALSTTVPRGRVADILREAGVQTRIVHGAGPYTDEPTVTKILEMYARGISVEHIRESQRLSYHRITDTLKLHNVERKRHGHPWDMRSKKK